MYNIEVFLDSSMVEHTAVNRGVVGSSPTRGAFYLIGAVYCFKSNKLINTAPWSSG